MTDRQLLMELARLLASLRARSAGYHGTGRHLGQDFELCQARPAFGSFPARPCSPRCAAVARALELAAKRFGLTVEDLLGWPKPIRRQAELERLQLEVPA